MRTVNLWLARIAVLIALPLVLLGCMALVATVFAALAVIDGWRKLIRPLRRM